MESGLFSDANNMEDGDSRLKAHLQLSVEAEVFIRREKGTEQRDQGRGLQSSHVQTSTVHSDKACDSPVCIILVQSSWIRVILAPWLKVSKSPRTGMPGGWGLYLLKLVPKILIQTCCSSTSYILVRVSTYRNNVKTVVGWITNSHCYNFPLLQEDISGGKIVWQRCRGRSPWFVPGPNRLWGWEGIRISSAFRVGSS